MSFKLTEGPIIPTLLGYATPMILGNVAQQLYNISDTLIVGKFIGNDALAAVGACYALIIFFTSIILGLCLGAGAIWSLCYGENNLAELKQYIAQGLILILMITLLLNLLILLNLDSLITFMNIPPTLIELTRLYLKVYFWGFLFVFIANFITCLLRALGNSRTPLYFLAGAAILNIILSISFVVFCHWGILGTALGTLIAQAVCAIGLTGYLLRYNPEIIPALHDYLPSFTLLKNITNASLITCSQQSVMNFGILLVQNLVNSFGPTVMAAFTIAVKIDTLAYIPAQDFGNAFSTFLGQNFGARKFSRIAKGFKHAVMVSSIFCLCISILIFAFAPQLMSIFLRTTDPDIISIGSTYLRIEGSFYIGIGLLFIFYGLYRAVNRPEISLVLTIISLGLRVVLAYYLVTIPTIGLAGIWWSIPIGWSIADIAGYVYYHYHLRTRLSALDWRK